MNVYNYLFNETYKKNINDFSYESYVSDIFFSYNNMKLIQQSIINNIYYNNNHKYKIKKQNEKQLYIIMKSYYLEKIKNLNYNIKEQIKELNTSVID